jgi:3-oxoadipate enol-lactonase
VWRAMQGVITRRSVTGELERIRTPTLILVGEDDVVTTPERAELLHARIAGSRLVRLPHVGHMSNLEQPGQVNRVLHRFLADISARAPATARAPWVGSWAEAWQP